MIQKFKKVRNKESVIDLAKDCDLNTCLIYKWAKEEKKLKQHVQKKKHQLKIHPGKVLSIASFEHELLQFIFERREQGIAVSLDMLVMFVSKHSDIFKK